MNLRDLLKSASPDVRDLNAELLDDWPAARRSVAAREDKEQIRLFRLREAYIPQYPELRLLFHVPNGGYRSTATAGRMKAMGVRAGIPDLLLLVPRGGYHGLAIEMKLGHNKPTAVQRWWITELRRQGYKVAVCYGAEEAVKMLVWYLAAYQSRRLLNSIVSCCPGCGTSSHLEQLGKRRGHHCPQCARRGRFCRAFGCVMQVNVKGALLMCHAAVEAMRRTGSGVIVNLTSVMGIVGYPTFLPFSDGFNANPQSKGSVTQITRDMGCAWPQRGFGSMRCARFYLYRTHPITKLTIALPVGI